MNGSWDAYLASPADFAGADDIITNLAKEREPGIEIIERTPLSVIITSLKLVLLVNLCLLCCSIVNYSEPKDRMVAVVRWYLSAFHAGRKVCLVVCCCCFYIRLRALHYFACARVFHSFYCPREKLPREEMRWARGKEIGSTYSPRARVACSRRRQSSLALARLACFTVGKKNI